MTKIKLSNIKKSETIWETWYYKLDENFYFYCWKYKDVDYCANFFKGDLEKYLLKNEDREDRHQMFSKPIKLNAVPASLEEINMILLREMALDNEQSN